MKDKRRKQRREVQLLANESTWLQKALFALQKADAAREKLADTRGEDLPDFVLSIGRKKVSVDDVQEALEDRVHELLDDIRKRRRSLR